MSSPDEQSGRSDLPLRTHRFPEPGEIFSERYRIDRLLGVGGFARVYLGTQLEIDRRVALKMLATFDGDSSRLSTVEKRFYREARLLSKLTGPNTIQMFDYGRTDDLLYLVFEYIEGEDLAQLIERNGALPEERAVRITVQMLRSLREAHACEILHRDVKPGNVMVFDHLGEPDCVKLLDFGIAKAVAAEAAGQSNLTIEGGVIGTPRYMSPEQSRGLPVASASDLFSVGLVVYEMLVGESALSSGELSTVQRELAERRLRLPAEVEVSARTRAVVDRLLEPDPDLRFGSADAVLQALGHASGTYDPAPEPTATGFPMTADASGTPTVVSAAPPTVHDPESESARADTDADTLPTSGGVREGENLPSAPILLFVALFGILAAGAWMLLSPDEPARAVTFTPADDTAASRDESPTMREPAVEPVDAARAEKTEPDSPTDGGRREVSEGVEEARTGISLGLTAARAVASVSAEQLEAKPERRRRPVRRTPRREKKQVTEQPVRFEPVDDL